MDPFDKNIIIANLKEKIFFWTPPKTGSITCYRILQKLNFSTYSNHGNTLIHESDIPKHNHSTNLFFGHEKFNLVTTLRNPYTLMISKFANMGNTSKGINPNIFSEFLETWFYGQESELKYFGCYEYSKRIPDSIIRLESMFGDYMTLPFVKETEYYKSGKMFNDCSFKRNPSPIINVNWKTLYNQNSADMVYYNFGQVFELGKYDKNSWK